MSAKPWIRSLQVSKICAGRDLAGVIEVIGVTKRGRVGIESYVLPADHRGRIDLEKMRSHYGPEGFAAVWRELLSREDLNQINEAVAR